MRLFLAVKPSKTLQSYFEKKHFELKKIGLKPVSSDKLHLTINFYSNVENPKVLIKKIREIKFKTFEIKTNKINAFPDSKTPKVIYLGINFSKELFFLKEKLKTPLQPKKFIPHITFARSNISNKKAYEEAKKILSDMPSFKIKVNALHLYSSNITKIGPIHNKLEQFDAIQ